MSETRTRRALGRARGVALIVTAAFVLGVFAAPIATADALDDELPPPADEDAAAPFAVALDAGLLRPLGAVDVVVGGALFVATTPFVAPAGRIADAWDTFVYWPYDYTFRRGIGKL